MFLLRAGDPRSASENTRRRGSHEQAASPSPLALAGVPILRWQPSQKGLQARSAPSCAPGHGRLCAT